MYTVSIVNASVERIIHDSRGADNAQKLSSGSIVEGINAISSFTFEINPHNAGYDSLTEYATIVKVYNTRKSRYDFIGRVLQISPTMNSDGSITKSVVCEDRLGYLQDSRQPYSAEQHYDGDENRTGLEEFIDTILANHNARVEAHKRIYRGTVTVEPFESSDGVTKGLNYQSTWNCIQDKLIGSFGGYIVLREADGVLYLDYLATVGTTRSTKIKVGRNMRSASKDIDASGIITRLIPLGAKITAVDESGNERETDERLTISGVNDGLNYIESQEYLARYGIKEDTVTWDDVTDAANLLRKGTEYLTANNGLAISHDIDALELSLIGLDIDDFMLYDSYPVVNPFLDIDDTLQIIKKTTNVIEPHSSSFEMGDILKRLSDTLINNSTSIDNVLADVSNVTSAVKNQTVTIYTYVNESISNIRQDPEQIWAAVEDRTVAKSVYDEFSEIVRNILQMEADGTTMLFQTINDAIQTVGNTESTHHAELLTHIRFDADGISIGKEGNAITMRLDNDSLDFYNNGTRVAYMSDNTLYITDGRFLRSVRIGNYGFIPEANGSVSFTYLGGDS